MGKLSEYWAELKKPAEQVEAEKPITDPSWFICEVCHEPINPEQTKTFGGFKYHRRCFKRNIKAVMKEYHLK